MTPGWLFASAVALIVGSPLLLMRWVGGLVRSFGSLGRALPMPVASGHSDLLTVTDRRWPDATFGLNALGSSRPFKLRHEEVWLRNLPGAFDGFRIGHLSDVHVGHFVTPDHLRCAIDALDDAGVDVQVLTGDLIDDMKKLAPTFRALEACRSPHGILAVLGNHEKWLGLDAVTDAYEQAGARGKVRLLVDEHVTISRRGAAIRVVGVDFPLLRGSKHALRGAERDAFMAASAARAFGERRDGDVVLCLSHHPDFFSFAAARGAQLTLAGHSHGGQVALFGRPLFSAFQYMLGRYQRADAHLYVSGGMGHWLPLRIGVPAEVTVITLRSSADIDDDQNVVNKSMRSSNS